MTLSRLSFFSSGLQSIFQHYLTYYWCICLQFSYTHRKWIQMELNSIAPSMIWVNTPHVFNAVTTPDEEQSWAIIIPLPPSGSVGQRFLFLLDKHKLMWWHTNTGVEDPGLHGCNWVNIQYMICNLIYLYLYF